MKIIACDLPAADAHEPGSAPHQTHLSQTVSFQRILEKILQWNTC